MHKIKYNGLRKRETYDQLVDFIERDPVIIHYPDRRAFQFRESHYLTQLDGEGMRQMESLEINRFKEREKKHILQHMSTQTGHSVAELAAAQTPSHHGFQQEDMFGRHHNHHHHNHHMQQMMSMSSKRQDLQ